MNSAAAPGHHMNIWEASRDAIQVGHSELPEVASTISMANITFISWYFFPKE